jgi:TPP-dependent trihydroxycyclohexane-1,2-dione (THcHDO) dehydratase
MQTRKLTVTQALISFLKNQYVERDGHEVAFFAGVWGIFGHVGQTSSKTRTFVTICPAMNRRWSMQPRPLSR